MIWLLQFLLATLLLVLLWQPAMVVAELKPQQNIIAILMDDSHSMGIPESGVTREAQAVKALQDGMLAALNKNFQTRLYRLDSHLTRVPDLKELGDTPAPATRIGDSLKQLTAETSDLPIGAVILLSDGSDNSGGVDLDTIAALRNRRIPVHTVGFGSEQVPNDIEIDDAVLTPRALADSRLATTVSFHETWLRWAKSHADGPRRRQSSGYSRYHVCRRRENPDGNFAVQCGRGGRQGSSIFH